MNFNAELHARPSIYFSGTALVENVALIAGSSAASGTIDAQLTSAHTPDGARMQLERHTEFNTGFDTRLGNVERRQFMSHFDNR